MAELPEFTSNAFQTDVLESDLPAVVDFSAEWCGPCKQLAPIVEKLAQEYEGRVKIGKVDIDQSQDLAQKYSVTSVPSVIFFKGGEPVDKVIGLVPEPQLRKKIDSLLEG